MTEQNSQAYVFWNSENAVEFLKDEYESQLNDDISINVCEKPVES